MPLTRGLQLPDNYLAHVLAPNQVSERQILRLGSQDCAIRPKSDDSPPRSDPAGNNSHKVHVEPVNTTCAKEFGANVGYALRREKRWHK